MSIRKIRTLVVDDSGLIRAMLKNGLTRDPRIEVVDTAGDGIEAIAKIKQHRPDVVTLDVEMPRMNGIGVLERVAGRVPIAFVMVSTLTKAGANITFEALHKGAFDYVAKPTAVNQTASQEFLDRLIRVVVAGGLAKSRGQLKVLSRQSQGSTAPKLPPCKERGWLVGIGISCGGPQTLTKMLPAFPSDFVPIVITQHMPSPFTTSFAANMDRLCAANVSEAKDGEKIENGRIYIAPGTHHVRVARRGVDLCIRLDDGPKVSLHKPSVDVMMASIARTCGSRAIGVIMTGMGDDGSRGIVEMHNTGAYTIAQDEESSLVYGMPKSAVATGCVDHSVSLDKIPKAIVKLMERGVRSAAGTR